MKGKALGMIETMGFVPAVEAGDVAVKTAEVTLVGLQLVGGGLVSVLMAGDVSSVKASVDAASMAAARLGEVVSVTVIARMADGLDEILTAGSRRPEYLSEPPAPSGGTPEIRGDAVMDTEGVDDGVSVDTRLIATDTIPEMSSLTFESGDGDTISIHMMDLKKLKVIKLRRLARQLSAFSIPRSEIKFAKKRDLLDAFTLYMKSLET